MVAIGSRSGITPVTGGQGFARPTGRTMGNNLSPFSGLYDTGSASGSPRDQFGPGPYPHYPGYYQGGQLGAADGTYGADPHAPKVSPSPRVVVLGDGQETYVRWALQGFNDKLTVKDRHAFWDTGNQKTGLDLGTYGMPNTYNDPIRQPPRPDLRTVNRTVSYQKGTDTSRNQDDLSRPYTWLGEQGSGWTGVNGGVPGLYQPYGTRGGVPYPIVDPTNAQGGREAVWAGPPHGLHSETYPDMADIVNRSNAQPQMRPVRFDRPSNSPQAGQSYSQTVQHQGQPARPSSGKMMIVHHEGRGWSGRQR